nr:hypothetical protein [Kofleriaceae bacterium]
MTAPAAWRARLLGHARSAHALDDPWGVAARAIEMAAAAQGGDWMANARAASARASTIAARGADAMGQVERLAVGVVRRRVGGDGEVPAELAESVSRLVGVDPEVDLERPRYRWRLPWCGDGLMMFDTLLAPQLAQAGMREAVAIPDADAALARCEELAGDAGDDLGDPAPPRAAVIAACDAMLARDARWPQPLRARHARQLRAAVEVAPTAVAVDVASHHAAACFAIEHAWWHALVATVGWPLRAALVATYEPDAAGSVDTARALADQLAGIRDPLAAPWLARLIAGDPPDTIELGEAGAELVAPLRAWRLAGGRELAALTATTPPVHARRVRLWDREVAVADLDDLLAAGTFSRPPA